MGRWIDWAALDLACELFGVPDEDFESLLNQLMVLRDFKKP